MKPASRFLSHLCILIALLALHGAVMCADALAPGQEGPLVVPGSSKDCVLYIPSDYKSDVPTPLIFFMHGSGGSPTTWPFRQATDGAGYIVCGLSYGAFPDAGAGGLAMDPEKFKLMMDFIAKVRAQLSRTYDIDQKQVILSGLSMGGWGVNFYGFQTSQKGLYCAYAIIAAGADDTGVDLTVTAGLPVLVLNGEKCPNLPQANSGMPALNHAGAIAKQVVLAGEPHVPSQASITPPLKAWLADVKRQAARAQTLNAVDWHAGTITGEPEHSGDTKTILTHLLANQPGLPLSYGEPALLFLTVPPPADPAGASRHAADTSAVEASAFSFPDATQVPVAAHDFTTIRIDVSGIDPHDDRLINRDTAPAVILLDRDHAFAALLKGRSQLSESSLMAAMRPLLTPDQRAGIDKAVAVVKPLEKSMKSLQRKLDQASARENQVRIAGGDDAAVQKQKDEFDSLDQQYQELRDQLAAASTPATAGATATATGSASATAGAPVSP